MDLNVLSNNRILAGVQVLRSQPSILVSVVTHSSTGTSLLVIDIIVNVNAGRKNISVDHSSRSTCNHKRANKMNIFFKMFIIPMDDMCGKKNTSCSLCVEIAVVVYIFLFC